MSILSAHSPASANPLPLVATPSKVGPSLWSRTKVGALGLLARLPTLRVASTAEERAAIYRFRYRVYVKERHRHGYGGVDHRRSRIQTPDDEAPESLHFYFGEVNAIQASVKVRHWRPGQLPYEVRDHYRVDRLPGLDQMHLCDTTQLMVEPSRRGSLTMLQLTTQAAEYSVRRFGVEAALAACSPGLVPSYRRLGFRDFGAAPKVKDVLLIPMVCLVGDVGHARRSATLWSPLVERLSRDGIAEDISEGPVARELAARVAIETSNRALREHLLRARHPTLSGLSPSAMRWLLKDAIAFEVPEGARVTARGIREHELYLALSGRWQGDPSRAGLEPGDVFGASGYFTPERRRLEEIRALTGGRLLMIRHSRLSLGAAKSPAEREAQRALYGAAMLTHAREVV